MKLSSKNRLMPMHQDLFPEDTLFCRIARTVCQAGVLPRKELYEAWEMARRVRRRFRGGRVVDLAVDAVRALKLRAAGYDIYTAAIPSAITPKNRLLMGEPGTSGRP